MQLRQQASFAAVTGWCVCKLCGDVENSNAEYVSSVCGKIYANPENLKHRFSQYLLCLNWSFLVQPPFICIIS